MWRSNATFIIAAVTAATVASPALGATAVTVYPDGAVTDVAVAAANGYAELKLPAGVAEKSIRVKPFPGTSIDRVEVFADDTKSPSKRVSVLRERRRQLEDRLKALETREEIFQAAAKSQSGKAPRKTKTNPDPMSAIRQGTQFAISQLEEVFRGKRLAEDELKRVDAELEAGGGGGKGRGLVARVWLKEKSGRVSLSYFQPEIRWRPTYDLRYESGAKTASLTLRAVLPSFDKEASVSVASDDKPVRIAKGRTFPELKKYELPVVAVPAGPAPLTTFEFTLVNETLVPLPAGEVSCFVDGTFIGKASLTGLPAGAKATISPLH